MHHRFSIAAIALLAVACADVPTEPIAFDGEPQLAQHGRVVHQVSVGSPDACSAFGLEDGCNGNFSLTAIEYADGSVRGQWQDSFGHGDGGVHIAVDCVDVRGNVAFVGGVVTRASGNAEGAEGARAITVVVDNGTSKNDPADMISFSYFPALTDCENAAIQFFALLPLEHGQVKVR